MQTIPTPSAPPPSFAALAQRAEIHRIQLWGAALVCMLGLSIGGRVLNAVVMATDSVFWPTVAILTASLLGQAWLWWSLCRADRAGNLMVSLFAELVQATDLGVPLALLLIQAWHSPLGPLTALSAPAVLMLPLLTLLSVLHLRPGYSLLTGLTGAVFHLVLVSHATLIAQPPADELPIYLGYSLMLGLIALASMRVARHVLGYVRNVAAEAAARYRDELDLAELHRDLAIAHDIQQGLLPRSSPCFAGFDIAGMSRPASEAGGDYYDWQPLPDGRLIICLADVSGHGIGPALVMAVCRAYARASAALIADPSALMRRLNELLKPDLPPDRFITLACIVLEQSGHTQLVSAGHGPSLLYEAATGRVQQLGSNGLPLGITLNADRDVRYEPATEFQLAEDDVLVLLTDGFFEWARAGDGEQVGIERVAEALQNHAGSSAAAILAALDENSRAFVNGQAQQDDMTAVVVKRVSTEHRHEPPRGRS